MKRLKKKLEYNVSDSDATFCGVFTEATVEELRVLVALRECGGVCKSADLAENCAISSVRLASALEFWSQAEVISEKRVVAKGNYDNKVIEEFEPDGETVEVPSAKEMRAMDVVETIRDKGLKNLFDELIKFMKKTTLSSMDAANVASLVSNYGLTDAYFMTLAAHLKETEGNITVNRLCQKANSLVEKEIITDEQLDAYIANRENEGNPKYVEYRRVLGITNRPLAAGEMELIDKWRDVFIFGAPIVKEAYNAAVMATGDRSFKYMDKLLTDWHEAGCKTVEECIARHNSEKTRISSEYENKKNEAASRRKKKEEPMTRFGTFDPEEVMKRALERTYGETGSENKEADNV